MDCTICDAGAAHLLQLEALERACFSAPWTCAQLTISRRLEQMP